METEGGGSSFWEYAIHQLEMIVSVMGPGVESLIHTKSANADHVVFRFSDGRRAAMTLHPKLGFSARILGRDDTVQISKLSSMFPNLIDAMLEFFRTGIPPIDRAETIHIAHVLRTAIDAEKQPDQWVRIS